MARRKRYDQMKRGVRAPISERARAVQAAARADHADNESVEKQPDPMT